jgi:hypothetical protein
MTSPSTYRIEVITRAAGAAKLCKDLEAQGHAYTLIPEVYGYSQKGCCYGDDPSNSDKNSLVLIFCQDKDLQALKPLVQRTLRAFGGLANVSPAVCWE